ncbi:MAG: hypothetical protein WA395_13210, partial [Nitrososphaeraceae archaeon]
PTYIWWVDLEVTSSGHYVVRSLGNGNAIFGLLAGPTACVTGSSTSVLHYIYMYPYDPSGSGKLAIDPSKVPVIATFVDGLPVPCI